MKILWVKSGKILPLDTGGKIRSYNILRRLSGQHEVTFLSYYGGRRDDAYNQKIGREAPGTVTVSTGAWDSTPLARGLDYLVRFPSGRPFAVSKFTSRRVRRLIARWMAESRFDVAVCDFLSASLNFPWPRRVPSVLFQHNVESVLWRRQARTETRFLKRKVFEIEAGRMARYERSAVRRFHHVIAVSEQDRACMAAMTDAARITVVPTGVDLSLYRPDSAATTDSSLVVFTGSMDWEPNVDGVEYFCGEIWPRILSRVPSARFRIVGRAPGARVRKLAGGPVEVTGRVESIIEHLRQAEVVVVPLRVGGGTRLKILEAMAAGKAVVSTSVGAEGLDVHHGQDIILADDPASFADAVVELIANAEVRRRYERAAAERACQYDWAVIAARFASVLHDVTRQAASEKSFTQATLSA